MKRLFTLIAMAIIATVSVSAQNLRFVDAQGKEIKDGSTLYMTKTEEDFFGDKMVLLEGVYVENTSSSDVSTYMNADIISLAAGSFQCCLGDQCKSQSEGTIKIEGVTIKAGEKIELTKTEWMVSTCTSGIATVTLQLGTKGNINGPKITVKLLYGDAATSVKKISATKVPVAYYSLDGKKVKGLQKGITLVKYSDGTVNKVNNK